MINNNNNNSNGKRMRWEGGRRPAVARRPAATGRCPGGGEGLSF